MPGILGQNGPQHFGKKRQQEGWHGKERPQAEAQGRWHSDVTLPPTGQKGAVSPQLTQWLPNLLSLKCPGSWLKPPNSLMDGRSRGTCPNRVEPGRPPGPQLCGLPTTPGHLWPSPLPRSEGTFLFLKPLLVLCGWSESS